MIFRVLLLLLDIVDRLEDFFMKINWIARIKNKSFWLALIPAVLLLVQTVAAVFGFTLDFGELGNQLLAVVNAVFAVLAICAGVCIYFFHKFVLDDIELFTCLQIFIPFAIFFFLSLFTVYLKRPVIRRVQREAPQQAPQRGAEPERRAPSRDDTFTEMNTGRYRENNEPERKVNRRV